MSSKPQDAQVSSKDDKREKSFSKLLTRAKTILKREGSSKRGSALVSEAGPVTKAEAPKVSPPPPMTRAQEARARYEAMQGVSRQSKAELFEERAKKLGERFGLEIKATEWQVSAADDTVLRVDKPIRMRVRRTCHRCDANFVSTKECPNCQHVRCTKCTRYPPRRTEEEKIASRERRAALIKAQKENPPLIADYRLGHTDPLGPTELILKKPSKTGGQDLVYKKPRQRVRRNCHECQTMFAPGNKECTNCGHIRCTDCPRCPPKKDKYPLGYPGDEFGPSSVPHYECRGCKTLYPTGAEHGTKCKECGLEKSDQSPRALPRKVEPQPDPEILERIEIRLAALKVT